LLSSVSGTKQSTKEGREVKSSKGHKRTSPALKARLPPEGHPLKLTAWLLSAKVTVSPGWMLGAFSASSLAGSAGAGAPCRNKHAQKSIGANSR